MYLEHYGLQEPPFSITPDPRFVFLSERHRDALAHLLFGIDKGGGGGFVQLTGEVGTGKTTLCRLLLEQLPAHARVALVLNPRQTPIELLETVCEELQLDIEGRRGSAKALVDALNAYLLDAYAQGLRVVLVIDEAQDLSVDALEQVRLLTNLETDTQKLLQVILLGQPELRDMLAREDLRQLAQRITARFHLTPLDAGETERYLRHRYAIAGGRHLPFDRAAIRRLHARAGGVPRLVNVIAERSLLAGYARDETTIGPRLVDAAADEALPARGRRLGPAFARLARSGDDGLPRRPILFAVAAAAMLLAAAWMLWPRAAPPDASRVASAQAPAAPSTTTATVPAPSGVVPVAGAQPVLLPSPAALDARLAAGDGEPLSAWQSLLALWRLPTDPDDVAIAARCAPTLAPGVYCLRARGDLDALSAIGRPVLLELDRGEHAGWAVLLGVDGLHARLRLGRDTVELTRVALQQAWGGGYAALWRGPAGLEIPVRAGSEGPGAHWVRRRLGLDAQGGLDAGARDAIRRYQAAHGLASDGVAGPETLFALAADGAGPHLLPELR